MGKGGRSPRKRDGMLTPGTAYEHVGFDWMRWGLAGPWAVAATPDTFLADKRGATAFFASKERAEAAYRVREKSHE